MKTCKLNVAPCPVCHLQREAGVGRKSDPEPRGGQIRISVPPSDEQGDHWRCRQTHASGLGYGPTEAPRPHAHTSEPEQTSKLPAPGGRGS